ncbi:DUF4382 domain-containing protein [Lutimonas vermicola]|uniref:DUF4382 domain-containing protein n=1 Tax=Lutimonas vermicola TaxID=414288 RepID=A0ABU9L3Q5_9FLAO
MKKKLSIIVVVISVFATLFGCNEGNGGTKDDTSRIQLKLIDEPDEKYKEVNIEIIDIQYNNTEDDEGWTSLKPVDGYPIKVDLTELVAGNDLLLSDDIIPSGSVNQIRLVLSDNNTLLLEGSADPIDLDTPSAEQSGLKLKLNTDLEGGFSYTFILDWDVSKSIVKAGNSGKYILKPVIRVNLEVNSGSISGIVVAEELEDEIDGAVPQDKTEVFIFTENDEYVGSTFTNDKGEFLVQGLDEGYYILKIVTLNYADFESKQPIMVTAGEITDAGTIELQVLVS